MSDMQIMHIYGSSYVCSGKYGIGIYLNKPNKTALLIDSGPDAETARAIDQELVLEGYRISAILHTHGHANNCGGDLYFKSHYPEIKIYSTPSAAPFLANPELEAFCFGKGISWSQTTREGVAPTEVIEERDGSLMIDNLAFGVMTLPGHFPGMVGFLSPDNVLYCGDALFGDKIVKKQRLLLYMDIAAAKRTFRKLAALETRPKAYVLYHGGLHYQVSDLIDKHLDILSALLIYIENNIQPQPITLEELIRRTMERYSLENELESYMLANMLVRSCLSELLDFQRIFAYVEDRTLLFKYKS